MGQNPDFQPVVKNLALNPISLLLNAEGREFGVCLV